MASKKFFGTDGVRGTANKPPMTAEIALKVGEAAGAHFLRGDHRHQVIIAKDTRLSGYMLEPALTAGFISVGMDVILVGPMPTPAVAMLTRSLRADLGVMISASHNPAEYNGIKFFAPTGAKVSPDFEDAISRAYWEEAEGARRDGGALRADTGGVDAYIDYLVASCRNPDVLKGRLVALDMAQGATHEVAPRVFQALGAEVVTMGDRPDGSNINDGCGALHPGRLASEVVAQNAAYGFCFDGDGDRMIPVTEAGDVLAGDITLAITGRDLQSEGRLPLPKVVATVMSNIGLEKSLAECKIELLRTPVGDRHVYESMVAEGHPVGGEQSGHLIFLDDALTGDGVLAAIRLVDSLASFEWSLDKASRVMKRYPQILINYDVARKLPLADIPEVQEAIQRAEEDLAGEGRIVLRYSGTEPLLRVMVEGPESDLIETVARQIGETVVQATL